MLKIFVTTLGPDHGIVIPSIMIPKIAGLRRYLQKNKIIETTADSNESTYSTIRPTCGPHGVYIANDIPPFMGPSLRM